MNINEEMNNEQQSIIDEKIENKPKNKKNAILKALLTILIIIALLCLGIFGLYKSTIDISAQNLDKFDYNLSDIEDNKEYNYLDFISYDSENNPDSLLISVPKSFIYDKVLKIHELNDDFNKNYEININRIGFVSNYSEQNTLDYYMDITYKNIINAYVSGTMEYIFTEDNGIKLVMKNMVIGDGLPKFIYESFLPYKTGDVIYEVKSKDYELLENNVLLLDAIKNIKVTKQDLNFEFDYISNLKSITNYVLGEDSKTVDDTIKELMPIILDIIINDNSGTSLNDTSELLS